MDGFRFQYFDTAYPGFRIGYLVYDVKGS